MNPVELAAARNAAGLSATVLPLEPVIPGGPVGCGSMVVNGALYEVGQEAAETFARAHALFTAARATHG
jgi:hypothetical protein